VSTPECDKDFEIHIGLPPSRDAELLQLLGEVFGARAAVWAKSMLASHPLSKREHWVYCTSRSGEIVSCLCLIPQVWLFGSQPIRVGQLELVATHPGVRRLGLVRRQMAAFDTLLRRERCVLSCVQGLPNFYSQFGYEYSIPLKGGVAILAADLPEHPEAADSTIRPYRDGDEAAIREIYEATSQSSFIRSALSDEIVRYQQSQPPDSAHSYTTVVIEKAGKITAYMRLIANVSKSTLLIRELGVLQYADFLVLLNEAKRAAQTQNVPLVSVQMPSSQRTVRAIQLLGGWQKTPWAWQTKVVDWLHFFQAIGPLLQSRIAATWFATWSEELIFHIIEVGYIRIVFRQGVLAAIEESPPGLASARVSSRVLAVLAFGLASLTELLSRHPDFEVSTGCRPLLDVLFPELPSFVHEVY